MAVATLLVASGVRVSPAASWRDAPEYVALFAPPPYRAAYRAATSGADLETVLADLRDDPALVQLPGAWTPRAQHVLDAFGRSGIYDRWKLARLYGSRQPAVARGARMEGGRVTESWTLVSPYPSADFARLEPGTLRIILRIAP
jgi:hypothetical protein